MKILFATSIIRTKGDVDAFLTDIIKELSKKIEHVYLLCLSCDTLFIANNVTVFVNPFNIPLLKLLWLFWMTLKITITKRITFYICFISEIVCIILSICSFLTRRKTFFWYCSVYDAKDYKAILAVKLSSYILTCSEIVKIKYIKSYKIKSNKIFNIGHGISTEKFHYDTYSKEIKSLSSSHFTIVSVARISPVKEWEKLVYATFMLKENVPNLRVVAIGSPSSFPTNQQYYEKLQQLIKDLKLDNIWTFVGPVENRKLIEFFKSANVVVLPGFAYKTILEALAAGKITLFEEKSARLIFPAHLYDKLNVLTFNDSKSLLQRLLDLIKDKDKFTEMSSFLSDLVRNEFSCERYVSKILRLVNKSV